MPSDFEQTKSFLVSISTMRGSSPGDALFYELDTVDNKVSSLLSHVSIMMAILALFYSNMDKSDPSRIAILAELCIYLLVTLGCLRGIFMIGPENQVGEYEEILNKRIEVVCRRVRAYKYSLLVTVFTTIAFIFTLIYHFTTTHDFQ